MLCLYLTVINHSSLCFIINEPHMSPFFLLDGERKREKAITLSYWMFQIHGEIIMFETINYI